MRNSNEILRKCCRCEIIQAIENFNKDKIEKMVYARYVKVVVKLLVLKTWIKLKNIMNKMESEEI